MDVVVSLIDIVLHLDKYLPGWVEAYGTWMYLILFLTIFCETGLVITPFLPGDSLLFVSGTLAASGALNVHGLALLLMVAAFSGDNLNYWIGRYLGPKVFSKEGSLFFNKAYLQRTQHFYQKHGGKTIAFARFMPIIRTFAPFVAGIGKMQYPYFLLYSFIGSLAWMGCFVYGGYYFGSLPFVKQNLTGFIFAIILISLLPAIVQFLPQRWPRPK